MNFLVRVPAATMASKYLSHTYEHYIHLQQVMVHCIYVVILAETSDGEISLCSTYRLKADLNHSIHVVHT